MDVRRIASAVASLGTRKAGGNVRSIDHQDLRRWITAVARMQSLRSQSTDQTGRREIRQARLPRLGRWSTGEPPRASPTAGASTDRNACATHLGGGRLVSLPESNFLLFRAIVARDTEG